jgi:hypothetical protein
MVDGMATHIPHSHFHQAKPTGSAAESLTEQAVLSYLAALEPNGSLHVEYDEPTLHWMLEQARQRRAAGSLHAAIVKTDRRIIGWYLYHLDRDRLANVLHVAADRPSAREVLDHLFYQAAARARLPQPAGWNRSTAGAVRRLLPVPPARPLVLVNTGISDLVRSFETDDALFSRFDGEWCLGYC